MKTVVLGLDGATFDLILPGVARGELPGFARLMREGAWGTLRSILPADSPSAWTTFATGVGPGRHGIYGFMARRAGSYDYDIGTSLLVRAPTLWDIASRRGLRVGVINVPFTYPPQPVNGFMVAGMMTPDLRSNFTYPPELRPALLREVPNYSVSHGLGRSKSGDPRAVLVRDFAATIAAREHAMRWLDAQYRPDLRICVFTALDRLQHFLWADMDTRHPDHDPSSPATYREAIRTAYRQLDGVIARTLDAADKDTLVIVLSDHGFQGVARTFYVNAWLAQRGYLTLTGGDSEPGKWKHRAARLARRVLAHVPGGEAWRERLRARRLISEAFLRAIDWRRTRAWFGLDRALWINVAGRDPMGMIQPGADYEALRSQLIAELESLADPETGHRIVAKVHRREDVFGDADPATAPDLFLESARDERDPAGRYVLSERLPAGNLKRFTAGSAPISGYHTPEGILLLWGKGVEPSRRLNNARIADVAPTILAAMGLPEGDVMEGKPLLDFRGVSKPNEQLKIPAATGTCDLEEKEREAIEQQLKDLGYLD